MTYMLPMKRAHRITPIPCDRSDLGPLLSAIIFDT
jgi:hypothetical protein